jgi:8-oxo-dGTP diphosphatase
LNDARASRTVHVVAGVIADADGRVLLAQRPAGKHLAGGWEFPGGKLEDGEAPLAGLQRELREELGIEVHAATPLLRVTHAYPEREVDLDVWQVTDWRGTPRGLDGQQLRWCARDQLATAELLPADLPVVAALLRSSVL